jgi:hypothetical protein
LDRQLGQAAMQPRKRWFRISLFKLFVLLTVACACLAIYVNILVRGEAQKAAVERFRNTGSFQQSDSHRAFFAYDYQMEAYDSSRRGMFTSKPFPHWLASLLGVDFVHNIELVDFDGLADEELVKHLRNFPGLKTVIVDGGFTSQSAWNALVRCRQLEELHYDIYWHENVPINFQNLANLGRLREFQIQGGDLDREHLAEIAAAKSLRTLRLIDIHIKQADLLNFPEMEQIESFFWKIYLNPLDNDEFRFIEKIPNVKKLALAGNFELTDEAFRSIEKLARLHELSIHGTNFTGSELHRLKKLSHLVELELGASKLNDEALKQISQLSELKHLEIGSTDVTDEGMKYVASLTNLRHLSIRDTEVSDIGLQRLAQLPNLKLLRVRNTRISSAAITEFKEQHPDCLIEQK